MVVAKGRVVGCKDLGSENCRMAVWVRMERPEMIAKFVAREFAMVYGDFRKEAAEIAEGLGTRFLA